MSAPPTENRGMDMKRSNNNDNARIAELEAEVCMYACMYVCMYVHVCVCMYVHVCVCMYVCTCVCVYV